MSIDLKIRVDSNKAKRDMREFSNRASKDVNKLEKNYNRLRVSTNGVVREIGALRNRILVTSFAIGGFIATTKPLIMLASDLAESQNAVNVVFGEGADRILSYGKTAKNSLGLANSEFNQLATVTGALLRDTGLSMNGVADQTIELTKRASDLASVFNTPVRDALSAINQAIRGETEAIRRYSGDVTDATLQQHLFAKGLDISVRNLTEQEKRLLRIEVLMKQTDVVAGDFLRTQDDLANKARTLSSNLRDIGASIGSVLVPALEKATGIILDFVDGVGDFESAGKRIAESSEQILNRQAQALATQIEHLQTGRVVGEEYRETLQLLAETEGLNPEDQQQVQAALQETLRLLAFVREENNKQVQAEKEKEQSELNRIALRDRLIQQSKFILTTEDKLQARRLEQKVTAEEMIPLFERATQQTEIAARFLEVQVSKSAELIPLQSEVAIKNEQAADEAERTAIATERAAQVANAFASNLGRAVAQGGRLEDVLRAAAAALATAFIPGPLGGFVGGFLGGFPGFQHGGSFQVPGSGGTDSQLVAFRATPGERVTVTTPSQSVSNNNAISIGAVNIVTQGEGVTAENVARAFREARRSDLL